MLRGFLLTACLGLSLIARSQPDLIQQIQQAYQANAYDRHIELTKRLLTVSRHPHYLYQLAESYAGNRQPTEALAFLRELADKQLPYAISANPKFESLRANPAFATLAQRFSANARPVQRSQRAATLTDSTLIPEGIALDPATGDTYLSSLFQNKIVHYSSGHEYNFTAQRQDGLYATLGMKINPATQELWVCSAADRGPDKGKSGLFRYQLSSGKLIKKYLVSNQQATHLFNDLVIGPSSEVYLTDSEAGRVYVLKDGADTLARFTDANFIYPNGIAIDAAGKHLFIADFRGLHRLDLPSGRMVSISDGGRTYLTGIDGLYYTEGTLLAIQDSGHQDDRIVRFRLDADQQNVVNAEVLQTTHPDFETPTTGCLYKNAFYYIANSQLRKITSDGKLSDPASLKRPIIMRLNL
ncbi:hypothetical protein IC229_33070 [Spirosoma sp. BT702]|uniref:SMP-30/Gluconolactonase/LRE-like region domain-containing protein n=1 Tax=Spirosoma profusum TaxID=2771354 RepID=A0A927GAX5_9BACT|nr:hypothetical protein [Spirosoma profusum]MBD2705490.1 hypothetical protein [Spirosoma profusum]